MTTVLVTGSRDYQGDLTPYLDQVGVMMSSLSLGSEVTLIHGGAKGVDTIAAANGAKRGWTVVEYAANWDLYKKLAGPIRNAAMVKQRPHLAFAALLPDSIGTRDCLKQLAKSTSKSTSRLQALLLLDLETWTSRWLSPAQLREEFG